MLAQVATEPGTPGKANEDRAVVGHDMVVLLDGATVRTDTGCIHGVSWYVGQLGAAIVEHSQLGPTGALAAAIKSVADLHRSTCDLGHPGTPSAAVAVVQVHEDELSYLVLGDITLLIETTAGLKVLCDDRVSQTALIERALADAHPVGSTKKAEALIRMKHAELALRNVPGGFWVATSDPTAVEHAFTGQIPLGSVGRVALLSDGATRAVSPFELYGWTDLLDLLSTVGPAELIQQVRQTETTDPVGSRWPRNKPSDDATAIFVQP